MTDRRYTQAEVLTVVTDLTAARLTTWIEHRIVQPVLTEQGHQFRALDIPRLQTLCDLDESFSLAPDALGLVASLMDQVHVMHADLEALMSALAAEPAEVRARIRRVVEARPAGGEAGDADGPGAG